MGFNDKSSQYQISFKNLETKNRNQEKKSVDIVDLISPMGSSKKERHGPKQKRDFICRQKTELRIRRTNSKEGRQRHT